MDDVLPLLLQQGTPSASPDDGMGTLMRALLDSEDIAAEPEFEGFFVNPVLCADTAAQVGTDMGFLPEVVADLPEQEAEDVRAEIITECIRRLLTEELGQEVLKRLNDMRLRLKRSGDRTRTAQVAVLQSFLRGDKTRATWPIVGLVQAIFVSSITAGFEMIEASVEALPDDSESTDGSLIDRLRQSSLIAKLDGVLDRIPGLNTYLEKQAEKLWEEGTSAVYEGSLYLGLYSQEELEGALEIWAPLAGYESVQEMLADDGPAPELSEETAKALIAQLRDHTVELFTPARLDQLRGRMDALQADPAFRGKWSPFILMLGQYLSDQYAVQNEIKFLTGAFLGEIGAAGDMASEDE